MKQILIAFLLFNCMFIQAQTEFSNRGTLRIDGHDTLLMVFSPDDGTEAIGQKVKYFLDYTGIDSLDCYVFFGYMKTIGTYYNEFFTYGDSVVMDNTSEFTWEGTTYQKKNFNKWAIQVKTDALDGMVPAMEIINPDTAKGRIYWSVDPIP